MTPLLCSSTFSWRIWVTERSANHKPNLNNNHHFYFYLLKDNSLPHLAATIPPRRSPTEV